MSNSKNFLQKCKQTFLFFFHFNFLPFQTRNVNESVHALLNSLISAVCGGFAAMILLIQLAQVSTCVNICLVSQIPGNSDGSVPFLVWSIFRWTIRNQSLLWYLWHYPGWFSWFYWFDTLQRIQTYHRVKLTDHFWFVLILVLCSSCQIQNSSSTSLLVFCTFT